MAHGLFIAVHGLSPIVSSEGYSLIAYTSFSLFWLLLLQNMGSRAHGLQ